MSTFSNKNHASTPTDGNVLTIKTVQIAPFRTLMTALKDILLETNISFEPDGIRIINMDKSHTILAHLYLAAQNFEFYECKKEKIIIGVNINQCKTQKLRLIEPDQEELEYPDVKFSSIITLPSADFQKIIRDLSCISDKLEIKSVGNELIFKCSGQFASAEIHRAESDGSMGFILKQDSSKIIQGEFSLKNLGYFIKCTNLCQQIEVYLENDLPLVVKYNVASLGEIKLCLAPLPSS